MIVPDLEAFIHHSLRQPTTQAIVYHTTTQAVLTAFHLRCNQPYTASALCSCIKILASHKELHRSVSIKTQTHLSVFEVIDHSS